MESALTPSFTTDPSLYYISLSVGLWLVYGLLSVGFDRPAGIRGGGGARTRDHSSFARRSLPIFLAAQAALAAGFTASRLRGAAVTSKADITPTGFQLCVSWQVGYCSLDYPISCTPRAAAEKQFKIHSLRMDVTSRQAKNLPKLEQWAELSPKEGIEKFTIEWDKLPRTLKNNVNNIMYAAKQLAANNENAENPFEESDKAFYANEWLQQGTRCGAQTQMLDSVEKYFTTIVELHKKVKVEDLRKELAQFGPSNAKPVDTKSFEARLRFIYNADVLVCYARGSRHDHIVYEIRICLTFDYQHKNCSAKFSSDSPETAYYLETVKGLPRPQLTQRFYF